jgi:O-antigen/teichoic acid export membrane protein
MSWVAFRRMLHDGEFGRLRRWAATFIEFSLVQGVVQLVGVATGIVVVRLLATDDYGLYTIANSVLGALVVLADGGIGTATVGIGGRVWQDPARLGGVINTARGVMRGLRNAVSVPVAIAFIWLLAKNGAMPIEVSILAVLVLAGGVLSLENAIDLTVARLIGNTRLIQVVGLAAAGFRLAAIAALALLGLLVETAMLAIVLGWAMQWWATRRWLRDRVPSDGPTDPSVRAELRSVVTAQLPNCLYFVLQGQISVWLLSIFGSIRGVADLGAVTRISVVFSVLLATMQNVIVPRYARCQEPERLRVLFMQICAGFAVLVSVPAALVAIAPGPVLWILGPQYAHLSVELVLAVLGASLGSIVGLTWSLNANKAWFPPSWLWIPLDLGSQLVLMLAIGVSTARQVLTVAILASLVQLTMNLAAGVVFIRRFRRTVSLT